MTKEQRDYLTRNFTKFRTGPVEIHKIAYDMGIQSWMSLTDGRILPSDIQPLVDRDFPGFGKVDKAKVYALAIDEKGQPDEIGVCPSGPAGSIIWKERKG